MKSFLSYGTPFPMKSLGHGPFESPFHPFPMPCTKHIALPRGSSALLPSHDGMSFTKLSGIDAAGRLKAWRQKRGLMAGRMKKVGSHLATSNLPQVGLSVGSWAVPSESLGCLRVCPGWWELFQFQRSLGGRGFQFQFQI